MQQRQNQSARYRSSPSNTLGSNPGNPYATNNVNGPQNGSKQYNPYQNGPGNQNQSGRYSEPINSTGPYSNATQHPYKQQQSSLNNRGNISMISNDSQYNTGDISRLSGASSNVDFGNRMGSDPASKSRKMVADMVIRDVYSKTIIVDGVRVPDASYQTHVLIKEYSQYPSQPPPPNLEISGTIKDRILIICSKNSGRLLIQKGKYNDTKNVYQIGRTWDMDELKSIARIGPDEIIVKFNKDYYWKISEGPERTLSFIRALAMFYGLFMGKYPILHGVGSQELNLPSQPPRIDSRLSQPNSLKKNIVTQGGENNISQDYYKDFDFTSNGQLPMKPMKVIERGSSSTVDLHLRSDRRVQSTSTIATEDNFNFTPQIEHNNTDQTQFGREQAQSFGGRALQQSDTSEKFSSPVDLGRSSNIGNIGNNGRLSFEANSTSPKKQFVNIDNVYNRRVGQNVAENTGPASKQLEETKNLKTPLNQFGPFDANPTNSPDFGIEEVTDESESEETSKKGSSYQPKDNQDVKSIDTNSNFNSAGGNSINMDPIDTSIQEIENLLDNQFTPRKPQEPSKERMQEGLSVTSVSQNVNKQHVEVTAIKKEEAGLNLRKSKAMPDWSAVQAEADPEIDEILDELNWELTDSGAILINKLTEELQDVKEKNIKELISLDFSNSNLGGEFGTSIGEVEHLLHIFKKMEIEFKMLGTDVGSIETSSKGLQVKFLNKQNLYSILQALLEKVSINSKDLNNIAKFEDFNRWETIPQLEIYLSGLYDALITIRHSTSASTEGLSSMMALKQFQGSYEKVTKQFIFHFNDFFINQLKNLFHKHASALENFSMNSFLQDLYANLAYSGITYFVKFVDPTSFRELNQNLNSELCSLFEKVLNSKLKRAQSTKEGPLFNTILSQSLEGASSLKKSRTLRLTRRDKGRKVEEKSEIEVASLKRRESEIEDPMVVNNLVQEAKELIILIRYFIGLFFHYDTSAVDFEEYLNDNSFEYRIGIFDKLTNLDIDDLSSAKSYATDESIDTMTAIFGSFINTFMKNVNPVDYRIPQVLIYVEELYNRGQNGRSSQDFLMFNFLRRLIDKFRNNWNKFVGNHVDAINKSLIIANCGILPAIKGTSELIIATERSQSSKCTIDTDVYQMISKSYKELTEALVNLFMRDDPLLKNHEFDDKERTHRNISVLQNVYYLIDQLKTINTPALSEMINELAKVFNKVKDIYFQKQLHKSIGKVTEFVQSYESIEKMNNGTTTKSNKKHLKTLLSGYTSKDITQKVQEIRRKIEKHFMTGDDMFERELVNRLWLDMESEYALQFQKLNAIIRKEFGNEIEYTLSKQEIHSIFRSVH